MPSHMSGTSGTNNQYNLNRKMNYSTIENNNGSDQYRSSDTFVADYSDNFVSSVPITTEEYRMRINSADHGYQRPISGASRSSAAAADGDLSANLAYLSLSRGLTNWSTQDNYDEVKEREIYAREAQQLGFIVGEELEIVKAKSHRSVIQNTPDRITCSFKDRYGQSDSNNKKAYLQLGVRVPTKEHVSEIVGKQGSKIKQIREKTGALITTPGEQEDHVFIIEAPPRTALHVAQIIRNRSDDITISRTQESRRRSSCPSNNGSRLNNRSPAVTGFNQSFSKIILASGRIEVPKIIVGRIIGTQGSIITTIQRDTGTEIRSPPKEMGMHKNTIADFEILVYQTANFTDIHEAKQRVLNAKQLIAHVAFHQLEKIRAEEAPYSNYQVQSSKSNTKGNDMNDNNGIIKHKGNPTNDEGLSTGTSGVTCKELLLTENLKQFDWLWSDIEKLDDFLAHEVVDRILEESKRKTKTRSEPIIYNNITNSLITLGESEVGPLGNNRPRHSLPETRFGAIPVMGLDSFYLQSSFPYFVNDNYLLPDADLDFGPSPGMALRNRHESKPRQYLNEHELIEFQPQDFADSGIHFLQTKDVSESTLMHQMHSSNIEPITNEYNRFTIATNNYGAHIDGSQVPAYGSLSVVDNSQWQYRSQHTGVVSPMTRTYADSVRPNHSKPHGTIGDHLKKTMVNNYQE